VKIFSRIALLTITAFAFSYSSFAQDISKKEVTPSRKHKLIEHKPYKKNCDLCVNLQPKKKSVQV